MPSMWVRLLAKWLESFGRDIAKLACEAPSFSHGSDQGCMKRLTPAQMAQALRGDFSAGLVMGILARNPGLIATGGKKFLDLILERVNKPALQASEG